MRFSKDIFAFSIALGLILLVAAGFIGKAIFSRVTSDTDPAQATLQEKAEKNYPSLPVEAFRIKVSKGDLLDVIDLRPQALYEQEHLPNSKRMTVTDLAEYNPIAQGTEVIIITLADDFQSMEQINAILSEKSFPYAFLEGGFASWKAIGGNLISFGDPNSAIDRSKVSFKTAEETKAILDGPDKNIYAIIDTRPSSSYRNGHIPTALNIPLSELEQRRNEIPVGRQVIAYGADDLESFRSAVRLYDLNAFSPYAIENGFSAWMEKKYETVK